MREGDNGFEFILQVSMRLLSENDQQTLKVFKLGVWDLKLKNINLEL